MSTHALQTVAFRLDLETELGRVVSKRQNRLDKSDKGRWTYYTTQFLTGHGNCNDNKLAPLGLVDSAACRCREERETVEHGALSLLGGSEIGIGWQR